MVDTYNKEVGTYNQVVDDYKHPDMSGHDEAFGETAARDFMAQNPAERYVSFAKNPMGYMSALGINPETEDALSDNVKKTISDLNATLPPIYNAEAVAYASNFPNDKAKAAFKSLASSTYGVDKIELLTTEQFNALLQNEQVRSLSEEPNNKYYVQNLKKAFDDRAKVEQYNADRLKKLQAIWGELQPLAEKKSKDILGINDNPNQPLGNTGFTVNPTQAQQTNFTISGTENSDAYTVDDDKAVDAEGVTVQGNVDDAPTVSFDGKVDDTPVVTMQGSMENPNYTYDEKKGMDVDPISVTGDLGDLGQTMSVPEANEQQEPFKNPNPQAEEEKAPTAPNFEEGFKLSEESKKKLNEKYQDYSVLGIMEKFATAEKPEDAFMAIFLGMLLYLPEKAMKAVERSEIAAKEKAEYVENRTQGYDDLLAGVRGWSAKDKFEKINKEFIEAFGNMPEMAAKLRKEHPELVEGLGLTFDENGRVQGQLKDKQIEALAKRVIENNYDKMYGHKPTKEQLKNLWETSNYLLKNGEFARIGQEQAMARVAQMQQQATPIVQPQVSEPPQPQLDMPPQTVQPTTYTVNPNIPEDTVITVTASNVEEEKTKDPEPVIAENFQVNTQALESEEMRNKVLSIDAKPLEERPKMDLKNAHDLSLSVSSPSILKDNIMSFNASYEGVKAKELDVQKDREALKQARQAYQVVNTPTKDFTLAINPQQRA